jgi:putative ABC transport system permease protein
VQDAVDALKIIGEFRSEERYSEMTRSAFARLRAGERELTARRDAMEREFTKAEDLFNLQERGIEISLRELAAARAELDRQSQSLAEGRESLQSGIHLLDSRISQLTVQHRELTAENHALDSMMPYLPDTEYHRLKTELGNGLFALEQGLHEARARKRNLEQSVNTLTDTGITDAYRQINDGERLAIQGRNALVDARNEFILTKNAAREALAASEAELARARDALHDMNKPEWYVLDRDANYGYKGFSDDTEKIAALGTVFPLIFFLVAALVSLTAITRLVDERRLEIGTLKSLGYGPVKIMSKYILYAFLPTLLGSLIGGAVGMYFFPKLIIDAYNMLYSLPDPLTPVNYPIWIRGTFIGLASTVATAFLSCVSALRETPATLLRPKAPKAGRRVALEYIRPLWKILGFTYKVTIRNLFRYKKRFLMTVIGIGGCTALLLTGFGIKDSLSDITHKQFGDLFHFDMQVRFSGAASDKNIQEAYAAMAAMPEVANVLGVYSKMMDAGPVGGGSDPVNIVVPGDGVMFADFITLRERIGRRPVPLSENAVVVSEKFAKNFNLSIGDDIYIKDGDNWYFVTVTGITEHYFMHYLYLSKEVYESVTGEIYKANGIYGIMVSGSEGDMDAVSERLLEMNGVSGVEFISVMTGTFDDILNNLDFVIVVLIISAGALAFIVLLNLTNINIAERVRELATIEVLGFYDREVSAYIFRENAVLTVLGAGVGLLFGIMLHLYVIETVEVDIMMFGREIKRVSFVYSILLTLAFSAAVNVLTAGKLKKINMVEALKSVE